MSLRKPDSVFTIWLLFSETYLADEYTEILHPVANLFDRDGRVCSGR